jgi:hypothetical protein
MYAQIAYKSSTYYSTFCFGILALILLGLLAFKDLTRAKAVNRLIAFIIKRRRTHWQHGDGLFEEIQVFHRLTFPDFFLFSFLQFCSSAGKLTTSSKSQLFGGYPC